MAAGYAAEGASGRAKGGTFGRDHIALPRDLAYSVAALGGAPVLLLDRGYALALSRMPPLDRGRKLDSAGAAVGRLLDALCASAPVDPRRIALAGHSAGGERVNLAVCAEPRIRCAISSAGFACGDDPANAPVHQAHRVRAAVLLIAGGADRTVDPSHGRAFYEALSAQEARARFCFGPGEPHAPGGWSRPNQIALSGNILEWLDRHLGAAAPEPAGRGA